MQGYFISASPELSFSSCLGWGPERGLERVKSDPKGEDDLLRNEGGGGEVKYACLQSFVRRICTLDGQGLGMIGVVGCKLIDSWQSTAYQSAFNLIAPGRFVVYLYFIFSVSSPRLPIATRTNLYGESNIGFSNPASPHQYSASIQGSFAPCYFRPCYMNCLLDPACVLVLDSIYSVRW